MNLMILMRTMKQQKRNLYTKQFDRDLFCPPKF